MLTNGGGKGGMVTITLNGEAEKMKLELSSMRNTTYAVSRFTQFRILFKRSLICNFRDLVS